MGARRRHGLAIPLVRETCRVRIGRAPSRAALSPSSTTVATTAGAARARGVRARRPTGREAKLRRRGARRTARGTDRAREERGPAGLVPAPSARAPDGRTVAGTRRLDGGPRGRGRPHAGREWPSQTDPARRSPLQSVGAGLVRRQGRRSGGAAGSTRIRQRPGRGAPGAGGESAADPPRLAGASGMWAKGRSARPRLGARGAELGMNRRSGSSPADAADGRTAAADRRKATAESPGSSHRESIGPACAGGSDALSAPPRPASRAMRPAALSAFGRRRSAAERRAATNCAGDESLLEPLACPSQGGPAVFPDRRTPSTVRTVPSCKELPWTYLLDPWGFLRTNRHRLAFGSGPLAAGGAHGDSRAGDPTPLHAASPPESTLRRARSLAGASRRAEATGGRGGPGRRAAGVRRAG